MIRHGKGGLRGAQHDNKGGGEEGEGGQIWGAHRGAQPYPYRGLLFGAEGGLQRQAEACAPGGGALRYEDGRGSE